jgi:DNA polymerase lambda
MNNMDQRHIIIDNLKVLQKIERDNNQKFKVLAYSKAIKALTDLDRPIYGIDDVNNIPGIGKGIHEKIAQIIQKGYTNVTKAVMVDRGAQHAAFKAQEEFQQIMAVGPVKAKELVEEHKIMTIEQLRQHPELLNDKQRMGLKYHEDFMKRIPRLEMQKHEAFLECVIGGIDADLIFTVTGSYRRGKLDSGDIDVLVTCRPQKYNEGKCKTSFHQVISDLKDRKYLVDDFALGEKKYNGVCRLAKHRSYRRIDIMFTEPDRYPFALLYFTGSQQFNIAMRNHALGLGYSLNEYGLKHTGATKEERIDHVFHNEEDVFKFLGLKYVNPVDREKGAIQLLA